MVVADEDPPRKRSRLSLKSSKKGENGPSSDEPPTLESAGATPQGPSVKPVEPEPVEDCPPPLLDLSQSDLPSDSLSIPPVASLENLGNTCFLNSVLEVLRYTPCFLEGLGEIYRHIIYIEKVKATAAERQVAEVKTEPKLSWELVKNLFKMFKRMEKREQMFFQFANADVTSMAVKPDKILDNIREFNPMFEGNMQHDAQELLRCLLCYLEDSEKELHSDYTLIWAHDPSLLKTPVKESPPALDSEKQIWSSVKDKLSIAGKSKPCRRVLTAGETLTQLTDSKAASSGDDHSLGRHGNGSGINGVVLENGLYVSANGRDGLQEVDEAAEGQGQMLSPSVTSRTKKRKFRSEKSKQLAIVDSQQDEVDGSVKSSTAAKLSLPGGSRLEGGRCSPHDNCSKHDTEQSGKRTRMSARLGGNKLLAEGDKRSQSPSCGTSRTCSKRNVNGESRGSPSPDGEESDEEVSVTHVSSTNMNTVDRFQPTILSMFGKRSSVTRRLGMRGRVVCRDQNGEVGEEGSRLGSQSDNKSVSVSEASRGQTTSAGAVSPRKHNGFKMNGSVKPGWKSTDMSESSSSTPYSGTNVPCVSPKSANSPVRKSPRKLAASASSRLNGTSVRRNLDDFGVKKNPDCPASPSDAPSSPSCSSWKESEEGPRVKSNQCKQEWVSPREKTPTESSTPGGLGRTKSPGAGLGQPKLMIKLEKCDRLCSSPTVSASAAMKALQTSSSAVRKVTFGSEETGNEHDSDNEEEEARLGMKASFQCVPLKSVSVKVEKCDMVCSSPEKSVSARFATTCLARQRTQRFNTIEKLFQGSMMMRTKCLECENCTERRESFQDVSVPLKEKGSSGSDSESDEEHDSCLLRLMQAFTEVERLQDDNKYFCDHCLRKNEAERSLHYDVLPNILTVHLKRFSASTGMFGCLSKINDYVTVPLLLSCLRYKCPKPCVRPDHRYTLFAIITHAGSTIMSGHYLSYIKVRPNADGSPLGYDTLAAYLSKSQAKESQSSQNGTDGETQSAESDSEVLLTPTDPTTPTPQGDGLGSGSRSPESSGERGKGERGKGDGAAEDDAPDASDYHWLECDDETIKILSQSEFQARLSEKDGALRGTPYVLFYHRLDTWRGK